MGEARRDSKISSLSEDAQCTCFKNGDQIRKETDIFHKLSPIVGKMFGKKRSSSVVVTKACNNSYTNFLKFDQSTFLRMDDIGERAVSVRICDELKEILSLEETDECEKCKLQVPSDLPSRIVREVLSLAECEPCGIRGCVLFIGIKEKCRCRQIGEIECDPSTVSTFELYLTLNEDTRPWASFKRVLDSFKRRLVHDKTCCPTKMLSKAFRLSKTKLYRPN